LRVAFSPDSRLLVTASKDETARVWEDGEQRHQLLHSGSVNDISVSRDGKVLATITAADDIVRLWSLQTGLIVNRFTGDSPTGVHFSPDQEFLAAYTDAYNKSTFVWRYAREDSWSNEDLLQRAGSVSDLDFGGKGLLAIASFSTAQIWNVIFRTEKEHFIHKSQVNSVHFNKEGTLLGTASDDGTARIWDSRQDKNIIDSATTKGSSSRFSVPTKPL
jgi:WD40 repeat protein